MTDYTKHVEVIELLAEEMPAQIRPALTAAIDLMRAAEPRDAGDELRHCEDALDDFTGYTPYLIRDQRVAARAEGYATGKEDGRHDVKHGVSEHWKMMVKLQREHDTQTVELAAVEAEIEQLRERLDDCVSLGNKAVAVLRAADKTEIERLRAESEERNGLLTKLANLRASASAACVSYEQNAFGMPATCTLRALRKAVEASR